MALATGLPTASVAQALIDTGPSVGHQAVLSLVAEIHLIVGLLLFLLYRFAQRERWALRYLGPASHRTVAAVAENVAGDDSAISPTDVASIQMVSRKSRAAWTPHRCGRSLHLGSPSDGSSATS